MTREWTYTVPKTYDGATVLSILRRGCGVSARLLTKLKRVENGITADGILVRSIDRLHAGQVLVLRFPEDTPRVQPMDIPLTVVYEDEDVLVIDKPPYLAVHPSAGVEQPTLAAAVMAYYASRSETHTFRPLNRLDRNTSGLLVAAKNAHAAHRLSGKIDKVYHALVLGKLEGDGVIEQPIRRREGFGVSREVGEGGQYCLTRWQSLASAEALSLLRVVIETGRTHQIRVHMQWLGHPLAGDTMYGTDERWMPRHALHCSMVRFVHPRTGQTVEWTSKLPDDMRAVIHEQGWDSQPANRVHQIL